MAKYQVTFSCGHTETVELYGKGSERERKIQYFEQHGTCSHCYAAAQEQQKLQTHKLVTMHYADYKKQFGDDQEVTTKFGSYNAETKTVDVYIPKYYYLAEAMVEEVKEAAELPNGEEKLRRSQELDDRVTTFFGSLGITDPAELKTCRTKCLKRIGALSKGLLPITVSRRRAKEGA